MLNNPTLKESRTWLLVCTWYCYYISFNNEHPVYVGIPYAQKRRCMAIVSYERAAAGMGYGRQSHACDVI